MGDTWVLYTLELEFILVRVHLEAFYHRSIWGDPYIQLQNSVVDHNLRSFLLVHLGVKEKPPKEATFWLILGWNG